MTLMNPVFTLQPDSSTLDDSRLSPVEQSMSSGSISISLNDSSLILLSHLHLLILLVLH